MSLEPPNYGKLYSKLWSLRWSHVSLRKYELKWIILPLCCYIRYFDPETNKINKKQAVFYSDKAKTSEIKEIGLSASCPQANGNSGHVSDGTRFLMVALLDLPCSTEGQHKMTALNGYGEVGKFGVVLR